MAIHTPKVAERGDPHKDPAHDTARNSAHYHRSLSPLAVLAVVAVDLMLTTVESGKSAIEASANHWHRTPSSAEWLAASTRAKLPLAAVLVLILLPLRFCLSSQTLQRLRGNTLPTKLSLLASAG